MSGISSASCVFKRLLMRLLPLRPHSPKRKRPPRNSGAKEPLAGPLVQTAIAEDEGQWIGLATGIAGSEPSPMLVRMFVTEPARRRGIGIALVESIVGWAQSRGAARLVLWVTVSNEVAIALYRRCGFRPLGITRPLAHTPTMIECEMVRALNL